MENEKQKKILFALIPIVIALLSFFVIARFTSSTEFNAKTIQSLDDKKTTVMELAAASTAASAAITLIPGDVGTPIACVFFSGYLLWRKEILRTGSVSCDPGEREGGGYDRDNLCVIHREYDRDCEADNR